MRLSDRSIYRPYIICNVKNSKNEKREKRTTITVVCFWLFFRISKRDACTLVFVM